MKIIICYSQGYFSSKVNKAPPDSQNVLHNCPHRTVRRPPMAVYKIRAESL